MCAKPCPLGGMWGMPPWKLLELAFSEIASEVPTMLPLSPYETLINYGHQLLLNYSRSKQRTIVGRGRQPYRVCDW